MTIQFAKGFQDYGAIGLPVVLDKIIFKNCTDSKFGQYFYTALSVCMTDAMTKTMLNVTKNSVQIKEFNSDVFAHYQTFTIDGENYFIPPKYNEEKLKETLTKIGIAFAIKFVTDYISGGDEKVVKDVTEIDHHDHFVHFNHHS